MHTIIWKFRVREDAAQAFIKGYGSAGDWAELFGRAEGYIGTELTRSVDDPQVFYTLDAWKSKQKYMEFHSSFGTEYRTLDEKFEGLTEYEQLVGTIDSD